MFYLLCFSIHIPQKSHIIKQMNKIKQKKKKRNKAKRIFQTIFVYTAWLKHQIETFDLDPLRFNSIYIPVPNQDCLTSKCMRARYKNEMKQEIIAKKSKKYPPHTHTHDRQTAASKYLLVYYTILAFTHPFILAFHGKKRTFIK